MKIDVIATNPQLAKQIETAIESQGFRVPSSTSPAEETILVDTCNGRGTHVVELTSAMADKLRSIDTENIGTPNYMGIAAFWSHSFRHYLRSCSSARRVSVHDAFLAANLPLNGDSPAHAEILINQMATDK